MVWTRTIHDGLPGETRAQIALRPGHDPEAADNVMINFAATAVDLLIDDGEIMLHVDPLRDHLRPGHDHFEQLAVRIFPVIIRMEKNAPVELDAAGERAPADDKSRIARKPPLRPHLTPVSTPAANLAF